MVVAGCFWRSYGRVATTHVDVLTAMARKGADLVAAGRLTAETLPELTYPFERAHAFGARAAAKTAGDAPPSLAAFTRFLERYRAFLDALDRTRRTESGESARTTLAPFLAALEDAGTEVRRALRAEGRT